MLKKKYASNGTIKKMKRQFTEWGKNVVKPYL